MITAIGFMIFESDMINWLYDRHRYKTFFIFWLTRFIIGVKLRPSINFNRKLTSMAINCSSICSFVVAIILIHWFIGVGAFTSAFISILRVPISLFWELCMFLLAYLIIFMTRFTHFMYWAWTLLAVAINFIYIGILLLTAKRVQ